MKYFALVVLLLAGVSVALAKVVGRNVPQGEYVWSNTLTVLDKCDYDCTRVDVPVCGKNGQCMQKFRSRCAMSAYNCRHPQKPFVIIDDHRCEQLGAPLCGLEDKRQLGLH